MSKICRSIILLIVFGLGLVNGIVHNKETVKNPLDFPSECGNKGKALICNPDHLLSEEEVLQLNKTTSDIIRSTKCPCITPCTGHQDGFVLGVAIVERIEEIEGDVKGELAMRMLASNLQREWALGTCGNDAIILVVTERKQIFTVSGYRTRQGISMDCFDHDHEAAQNLFSNGKWFDGLKEQLQTYSWMLTNGCDSPYKMLSVKDKTLHAVRERRDASDPTEDSDEEPEEPGSGTTVTIGIYVGGGSAGLGVISCVIACICKGSQ